MGQEIPYHPCSYSHKRTLRITLIGPPGCCGAANNSGWMQAENFLQFLKHFVKFVNPSNDRSVLVLLDNHHSHLDINVLNYAKDNGIVLLSFPPHFSHKLQPLDASVFGPFKKIVSTQQSYWMGTIQGKL